MLDMLILGGGISGRAAERLAVRLGLSCVVVSDADTTVLPEAGFYVASPGMHPLRSNLYRQALASGREMLSELEFGFRHLPSEIAVLAVTGTNGKTTTTEVTTHLLDTLGVRVAYAGNIGVPLADVAAAQLALAPADRLEAVVVEVSSFQLELCSSFAPEAAVLLNLESDHEDRYRGGFAEYCEVKRRIFKLVPAANRIYGLSFASAAHRVTASGDGKLQLDGETLLDLSGTKLAAAHNVENLAAAVELALRILPRERFFTAEFQRAVKSFTPGAHRCELVAEKRNVRYINDSKATNPAAVLAAVGALPGPLVILLGGRDKGMDFTSLRSIAPRLRAAVLFGDSRERIAGVLKGSGVVTLDCGMDFKDVMRRAVELARPGDTVLLSPACASFDMFKSYEDRGEQFRKLVEALPN